MSPSVILGHTHWLLQRHALISIVFVMIWWMNLRFRLTTLFFSRRNIFPRNTRVWKIASDHQTLKCGVNTIWESVKIILRHNQKSGNVSVTFSCIRKLFEEEFYSTTRESQSSLPVQRLPDNISLKMSSRSPLKGQRIPERSEGDSLVLISNGHLRIESLFCI